MSGVADNLSTVYVISGANRGLGYGVTEQLAKRSSAIVYAGARDPSKADKLQQLAKQHSNVHVVQLRADLEADHRAVAARLEAETGRVDVVWANAGICPVEDWTSADKASVAAFREHIEVNTIHPLLMYQTLYALLGRSSNPKFMVSSTGSASITLLESVLKGLPQLAYGVSKAAVNNLTRRIHFENEKITAVPFHPGMPHIRHSLALARS